MFEEKIERAGNTNRREHPDGLMEEQMLDNESIDVTGLAWGEILRKHSQEGKKWLWYRNGREVLGTGESTGQITVDTFRGDIRTRLKLRNAKIFAVSDRWEGWVGPTAIWIPRAN